MISIRDGQFLVLHANPANFIGISDDASVLDKSQVQRDVLCHVHGARVPSSGHSIIHPPTCLFIVSLHPGWTKGRKKKNLITAVAIWKMVQPSFKNPCVCLIKVYNLHSTACPKNNKKKKNTVQNLHNLLTHMIHNTSSSSH